MDIEQHEHSLERFKELMDKYQELPSSIGGTRTEYVFAIEAIRLIKENLRFLSDCQGEEKCFWRTARGSLVVNPEKAWLVAEAAAKTLEAFEKMLAEPPFMQYTLKIGANKL